MKSGIIILFEGPDGAGKVMVLEQVLPVLQEKGYDIITIREPGDVEIVGRICDVVLDVNHITMDSKIELLLYIAARHQYYVREVPPALGVGKVVSIDHSIDSSITYQDAGRGLDKDIITRLNDFVADGREPDLTLYSDVESETGLTRVTKNVECEVNRLDLEELDMHKRVREDYLALAEQRRRIVTISVSHELADIVPETLYTTLEQLAENE